MTIQELIDKLKTFPPETMVVVKGYEDGYNDISSFEKVALQLNAHEEWYYGQHDITKDLNAVKAVALLGVNLNAKEDVKWSGWGTEK
jgi:hypothetical protein